MESFPLFLTYIIKVLWEAMQVTTQIVNFVAHSHSKSLNLLALLLPGLGSYMLLFFHEFF